MRRGFVDLIGCSALEAVSALNQPVVASLDGVEIPRLSPMPPKRRCERGAVCSWIGLGEALYIETRRQGAERRWRFGRWRSAIGIYSRSP